MGLSFGDISTGEMNTTQLPADNNRLFTELGKFSPNEIIFNARFLDNREAGAFIKDKLSCTADLVDEDTFAPAAAQLEILRQFKAKSLLDLGLDDLPLAAASLGALLAYLKETQRTGLERIQAVHLYHEDQFMRLDLTARRNLELTETMRGRERRGTLLWVLDRTKTSMGKRLMKSTIEQPLVSPAVINRRLQCGGGAHRK